MLSLLCSKVRRANFDRYKMCMAYRLGLRLPSVLSRRVCDVLTCFRKRSN